MERLWLVIVAQLAAFFFAGGTPVAVLAGIGAGGYRHEVIPLGIGLNVVVLGFYVVAIKLGTGVLRRFMPQKLATILADKLTVANKATGTKSALGQIAGIIAVLVAPPLVVAAIICHSGLWKQLFYVGIFMTYRITLICVVAITGSGLLDWGKTLPPVNVDMMLFIVTAFVLKSRMTKKHHNST